VARAQIKTDLGEFLNTKGFLESEIKGANKRVSMQCQDKKEQQKPYCIKPSDMKIKPPKMVNLVMNRSKILVHFDIFIYQV
jgi:hypothetical protein